MSKIHVLEQNGNMNGLNTYTVVVHGPAPTGNNIAGVPWTQALQNSGNNVSMLTNGNGAGQITTTELNSIQNGNTIEGVFTWGDNPEWTNQQRLADLDLRATQLLAALTTQVLNKLQYFGFTRT